MQWTVHGERQIYSNPWVNLWLVDVQQPDGQRCSGGSTTSYGCGTWPWSTNRSAY